MRAKILAHFVLLMTLLVTAQMLTLHDSEVSHNEEQYPLRVRIVNFVHTHLALVPAQNGTAVAAWLRDSSIFFWKVYKNSDGTFSFQAHNGKYLACPNKPQGWKESLQLMSPASVINQKFIRENTTYVGGYILKCAEGPIHPIVGLAKAEQSPVYLYQSYGGPQFDLWMFRYD